MMNQLPFITESKIMADALTSPSQIFFHLFGECTLQQCLSHALRYRVSRRSFLVYLGLRILLIGREMGVNNAGKKKNVLESDFLQVRKEVCSKLNIPISCKSSNVCGVTKFTKLLRNVLLYPPFYVPNLLLQGNYIYIDHQWNLSHSQLSTMMLTDLTMSLVTLSPGSYPFMVCIHQHIPSPTLSSLFTWISEQLDEKEREKMYILRSKTIVLDGENIPTSFLYPCTLSTLQYLPIQSILSYPGEYYHPPLSLYVKVGKNGMGWIGKLPCTPSTPSFSFDESKDTFTSPFEEFNGQLVRSWWPYSRKGYERHTDTLLFSSLLVNCYHYWKALHPSELSKYPTCFSFYTALGWELIDQYGKWMPDEHFDLLSPAMDPAHLH